MWWSLSGLVERANISQGLRLALGLMRVSMRMGRWSHGTRKWVPSTMACT